ncbi:hypothetical protein LWH94_12495, partial [Marinobacter sp. G11]|uniref:hypothetical protein n=1 Tax=Marinobacter sp. G11 TaxID=2903522 RepID=UPI001E3BF528
VLMGESGSLPGWQLCRGISGSFRVEWVAGFVWNQWQPWSGIRTFHFQRFVYGLMKRLWYDANRAFPKVLANLINLSLTAI